MTQQVLRNTLTKMQEAKKEEKKEELLKLGPNLTCEKGSHEFKYRTGSEVECLKCPIGYPLGPGAILKDGHIYIHGEFAI